MPVPAALVGMSWEASAVAVSGSAEAVNRVTIRKASVLFMVAEDLHLRYKRLFFLNTILSVLLERISDKKKKNPERSKNRWFYCSFTEIDAHHLLEIWTRTYMGGGERMDMSFAPQEYDFGEASNYAFATTVTCANDE